MHACNMKNIEHRTSNRTTSMTVTIVDLPLDLPTLDGVIVYSWKTIGAAMFSFRSQMIYTRPLFYIKINVVWFAILSSWNKKKSQVEYFFILSSCIYYTAHFWHEWHTHPPFSLVCRRSFSGIGMLLSRLSCTNTTLRRKIQETRLSFRW
jgi:hypothetical protein